MILRFSTVNLDDEHNSRIDLILCFSNGSTIRPEQPGLSR